MITDIVLLKAEFSAFIKQYTTHKVNKNNNRFNQSLESIRLFLEDNKEKCHFIYLGNAQIGGVIYSNNAIKHLFLYPEFQKLESSIIRFLHLRALEGLEDEQSINSLPSDSHQAEIFGKLGYKIFRKLRCMVRPINKVNWSIPPEFSFRNPKNDDKEMITKLFYDANINEPWHQPVTMEQFVWATTLYFEKSKTIYDASTICFDSITEKPAGACLISMDEGYPFVFDLHVLEEYRRKGLALNMMKKALSKLYEDHEYMRLFVVEDNPAQLLYEELGFTAGSPVYIMKYTK